MEKGSRLNREILGVVIFALALLIALSLLSYHPTDRSLNTPSGSLQTQNWGGIVGAYLADLLLQGLGLSAYLLAIFLFAVSYNLFRESYQGIQLTKSGGYALFLWSVAVLTSLLRETDVGSAAGGIVGDLSKDFLVSFFSRVGAYLIVLSALLLAVMSVTQGSLLSFLEKTKKTAGKLAKQSLVLLEVLNKKWRERREKAKGENTKKERKEYVPPPIILKEEVKEAIAVKDEPPRKLRKKPAPVQEQFPLPEFGQAYTLPSPSLLDPPDSGHVEINKETLDAIGLTLQRKLTDLGVEGHLKSVHPGPVITMFKFEPAAGVKVRRIVTLADDLAMALRALSVRILAPIPGESVVGIEIPNPRREKVFLQQVIGSDDYQNAESKLTLALGKAISGLPYLADLARMPHLLVAGATGTGKSVSINAMILS